MDKMTQMEQVIEELKRMCTFKEDTNEGDLVLVVMQEPQFMGYALVGPIERDETRRDEWWHVTLHLLAVPVQTVVWTLREPQFTGQEIFTMGGNPRFIKAINLPTAPPEEPEPVKKPAKVTRFTKIK